jgi:hypothetical protein
MQNERQRSTQVAQREPREFAVAVRRDGKTTERTVWADTWFDVWCEALDENGHDCRIEVKVIGGAA